MYIPLLSFYTNADSCKHQWHALMHAYMHDTWLSSHKGHLSLFFFRSIVYVSINCMKTPPKSVLPPHTHTHTHNLVMMEKAILSRQCSICYVGAGLVHVRTCMYRHSKSQFMWPQTKVTQSVALVFFSSPSTHTHTHTHIRTHVLLQVLAGDIEEAICTHAVYYSIWRRYSALPERFDWNTKLPNVKFYPLRPELVESTYLLYQVTPTL